MWAERRFVGREKKKCREREGEEVCMVVGRAENIEKSIEKKERRQRGCGGNRRKQRRDGEEKPKCHYPSKRKKEKK